MRKLLACFLCAFLSASVCSAQSVQPVDYQALTAASPTEGVIDDRFVSEPDMKQSILEMLARFTPYMKEYFSANIGTNSEGQVYGAFRSRSGLNNNEDGVRTNADLGMTAAFLCRYARGRVTLPQGVTWQELDTMAHQSLIYALSTHKANRTASCSNGQYWGSTSVKDAQWESSLWSLSVAYQAFFLWQQLDSKEKQALHRLLKAECQYELERNVPTGFRGDTKAEENGWEADVLAVALGLFPTDEMAEKWFERLRIFAVNSYSHLRDSVSQEVIDPDVDSVTVGELYRGRNLFDDYTLQNHHYFHTSYQNVVIQELGEAALALRLFQRELYGNERWQTRALMHNCAKVEQLVLNWLALNDGELAMPNGNDWSLFLYDQITSYSTCATMLRDPDALMLENMAFKHIRARQSTTPDGAWLLRSDIGQRRMGVEAHRVLMTWLMHEMQSTAQMAPTAWEEFRQRHSSAKLFPCQNIVRAFTKDRFTTFSWAKGIKSYTGYFAPNVADRNKIVVPFKQYNTGNILGWYEVKDCRTDATPSLDPVYLLDGDGYLMNAALQTNEQRLSHHFSLYSTPGNALVYLDCVTANEPCEITKERGGLLAISADEFTSRARTLYYMYGSGRSDGSAQQALGFQSPWVNIDNFIGVVTPRSGKRMAFTDRADNNSIMTAKLYTLYSDTPRKAVAGQELDRRQVVYYCGTDTAVTRRMSDAMTDLRPQLPAGWNGLFLSDPDGTRYVMVSRFNSSTDTATVRLSHPLGAPVLTVPTTVQDTIGIARIGMQPDRTLAMPVRYYVRGRHVVAWQQDGELMLRASRRTTVSVTYKGKTKKIKLAKGVKKYQ